MDIPKQKSMDIPKLKNMDIPKPKIRDIRIPKQKSMDIPKQKETQSSQKNNSKRVSRKSLISKSRAQFLVYKKSYTKDAPPKSIDLPNERQGMKRYRSNSSSKRASENLPKKCMMKKLHKVCCWSCFTCVLQYLFPFYVQFFFRWVILHLQVLQI